MHPRPQAQAWADGINGSQFINDTMNLLLEVSDLLLSTVRYFHTACL